jgi:hypothetical protein
MELLVEATVVRDDIELIMDCCCVHEEGGA